MNKDTALKFINAMKNIAYDKSQYSRIRFSLRNPDEVISLHFANLKLEDLPDAYNALDEFQKVIEDLPEKYMEK